MNVKEETREHLKEAYAAADAGLTEALEWHRLMPDSEPHARDVECYRRKLDRLARCISWVQAQAEAAGESAGAMTVYLVVTDDWEDRTVEGVFSTPDAAHALARTLGESGRGDFGVYVDEFVVDAPCGDRGEAEVVMYRPVPKAADAEAAGAAPRPAKDFFGEGAGDE